MSNSSASTLRSEFDPLVEIGVGEVAERHAFHRNEVDGEDDLLPGEAHHQRVVGMVAADIDQLQDGAAEIDRRAVAEGDLRHRGRPLLADDGLLGLVVRHHRRRIGPHLAAGDMVGMVVAVDHELDRLVRPALLQLVLEPARRCRVDRIGGDDARRRHGKHRIVAVVAEAIDLARDLGDLAHRRLRLGVGACTVPGNDRTNAATTATTRCFMEASRFG